MFEFPARTTVSVVDDDIIRQFRLALLTINFTALKIVLVPSILVKTRIAAGSVTLNNIERKEFRQCIYKAIKGVCCLTYSHRYCRNERRTHAHAKKPGIITIGQMQDLKLASNSNVGFFLSAQAIFLYYRHRAGAYST
jgi:hypothetical protein